MPTNDRQQAAGILVPPHNPAGILVPPVPVFPEDVLKRFPSLRVTQTQWEKWARDLAASIRNGA